MEPVFQNLGIAVLLGLLVGLQREHAITGPAGMRTFPLITVLGTVSAVLAGTYGGWIVGTGLLGIVAVLILGHLQRLRDSAPHHGTTTDVAMLLMFAVGALLTVEGMRPAAVAVGGAVAVLLQFKPELHYVARKLGDADLRAIMQFVLITCIILPVLPNRTFGPLTLKVFNPYETWLMVVLIVGMSLGGYILYKFLGRDAGILLGGVLGGAISSTATTVSYARGTRGKPLAARIAAVVILIASTVMYARILISVAVVSRDWPFFRGVVVPLAILMALTLAPALVLWLRIRRQTRSDEKAGADRQPAEEMPSQENPTQLKSAVLFGLMYTVVLFALAAAKQANEYVGDHGLYAVAAISGLTEMDAITLSTARMYDDPLIAQQGWRILVIGAMANLCSKACLAGIMGGRRLLGQISLLFLIPLAGGLAMLLLY
jgi:uncharacterized membrane protein (DUF4010 family)